MKIFKTNDYMQIRIPPSDLPYKPEILTDQDGARNLGGIFGVLPPASPANYHYHEHRDSVLIALSGQATEIVEGREIQISAGDVLYIPPGERHGIMNNSGSEFRYLEFFTYPPIRSDFLEVKQS